MSDKGGAYDIAAVRGMSAVVLDGLGDPHPPYAVVDNQALALGYVTKARILYFFMGTAAAMFIAADVIAEFDKDPSTKTATYWMKTLKHWQKGGAGLLALAFVWLILHVWVDSFPL